MIYPDLKTAQQKLSRSFLQAPHVHAQKWQGVDVSKRPEAKMAELLHEDIKIAMQSDNYEDYTNIPGLNLPWCDKHFEERISGAPMNPGTEWANWPWGNSAADHLEPDGKFNHNYMERYWPKRAGIVKEPTATAEEWDRLSDEYTQRHNHGIRYDYGDLGDLMDCLALEPDTRQAYLPIFFPEDTGTMNPTRKPCTLGYHFILRHGFFHCTYYMRSCDFVRHWADDCYLTIRLHLWILSELRRRDPDTWNAVKPGFFNMHITSLHLFINDLRSIQR
jgi:hypothetical protein